MGEFRGLDKHVKADLYFTVTVGTAVMASVPRKYKRLKSNT